MQKRANGVLLLLVACLAAGCMTPAGRPAMSKDLADPRLVQLGDFLEDVLEDGDLPADLTTPDTRPFKSRRYGVRADYYAWISYIRDYNRRLEETFNYEPFPILRDLKENPLDTPWKTEAWLNTMLTTKGTSRHWTDTVARLLREFPGQRARDASHRDATTIPTRRLGRTRLGIDPDATSALNRFTETFNAAAATVRNRAWQQVPLEHRKLLQFIVPWICRTDGRFVNRSKNAPYYGFHMTYSPSDEWAPGDSSTTLGMRVPPALYSQTGAYHLLRALAGQHVETAGIKPDMGSNALHPYFTSTIDFAAMTQAFEQLCTVLTLAALDQLAADLRQHPVRDELVTAKGVTGQLLAVMGGEQGQIVIGGRGRNIYSNVNAAVILDIGGDDDYITTHSEKRIGIEPVSLIVDFDGDDLYVTRGVGGPASGILGIGILIDRAGNDRYCQGLSRNFVPRANNRQTLVQSDPEGVDTRIVPFNQLYGNSSTTNDTGVLLNAGFAFGSAFLGIGILVDESGDDLYLGQKYVFGASMWRGVGMLQDQAGDDVYVAGVAALGAGINLSFGLLDDRSGNDHYQCLGHHESGYSVGQKWDNGYTGGGIGFGSSWRAEARKGSAASKQPAACPAGVGIVHDASGDDSYIGSSFGVAAAYAGGAGIVVDDEGNDTYFVKRGPGGSNRSGWSGNHALGNGCHRGFGYLLDRTGDDRYSASGLGGGTAWDIGAGYLLDLGGDDAMIDLHGKNFGGNTGWGAAKGLAVSFHVGGTDTYTRATYGDSSAIAKGYPGHGGNFSFFIDLGPEQDSYPRGTTNNTATL